MILLMQAEVERFHAGNLLLHDYFQTKVQDVTQDNSVILVSSFSNMFCVQSESRAICLPLLPNPCRTGDSIALHEICMARKHDTRGIY